MPQLIDVLSTESFLGEHLPGAVNICVYETAFIDKVRLAFPDPETQLKVYGLSDSTLEAKLAVAKLNVAGYKNVTALSGGLEGWKANGGEIEPTKSVAEHPPSGSFEVDKTASFVEWTGRNLFNRHTGTVQLRDGHILIENGRLAGGQLTIDMTTLRCSDIADPALNALLIGHLKSDDFFSVDRYPGAEFIVASATLLTGATVGQPNYQIGGTFTLRGVTKLIEFPAVVAHQSEGAFTAQALLDLDRTEWGAIYGSAKFFGRLGQHLVNDDLHLHLKIVTAKQPTRL